MAAVPARPAIYSQLWTVITGYVVLILVSTQRDTAALKVLLLFLGGRQAATY